MSGTRKWHDQPFRALHSLSFLHTPPSCHQRPSSTLRRVHGHGPGHYCGVLACCRPPGGRLAAIADRCPPGGRTLHPLDHIAYSIVSLISRSDNPICGDASCVLTPFPHQMRCLALSLVCISSPSPHLLLASGPRRVGSTQGRESTGRGLASVGGVVWLEFPLGRAGVLPLHPAAPLVHAAPHLRCAHCAHWQYNDAGPTR